VIFDRLSQKPKEQQKIISFFTTVKGNKQLST